MCMSTGNYNKYFFRESGHFEIIMLPKYTTDTGVHPNSSGTPHKNCTHYPSFKE